MKLTLLSLITFCCLLSLLPQAGYAATEQCPVGFERVDLRYNHAGGQSVPQLNLAFFNRSRKTVRSMVISLSIQDTDGNPHPYKDDLTYDKDVLSTKDRRTYAWDLDAASVDIHHTGESVTLQTISFNDGTEWKDDGSLACTLTVDFHAK